MKNQKFPTPSTTTLHTLNLEIELTSSQLEVLMTVTKLEGKPVKQYAKEALICVMQGDIENVHDTLWSKLGVRE